MFVGLTASAFFVGKSVMANKIFISDSVEVKAVLHAGDHKQKLIYPKPEILYIRWH